MFNPDPGSEFFPSQISEIPDPNFSIPDLGFASKNLRILTPKNLENMVRVVHPGSGS
jgi:hypothetical protein